MEITAGHVWTIVAAALVFFMTPGLALFYGGMTRAKGVLNMMMMSFASIIVVTVLWTLYGHSLAFSEAGNSFLNNIVGGFENLGLALAAAGATFADIVKFGVYVTDMSILPVVREIRDRHVDPAQPPASTAVQVVALFRPGYLVEIDALAVLG